jgi:hypothetical protein
MISVTTHSPDVYFKQGLSAGQRQRIDESNRELLK